MFSQDGTSTRYGGEWLRPNISDFSFQANRSRLLLAISEAEHSDFKATKQALIELLRVLESSRELSTKITLQKTIPEIRSVRK